MLTLLDTHAWIWWVTEDRRLSPVAQKAIERASAKGTVALSLISTWEVAKKAEKGQLVLDRAVEDWIDQATARTGLQLCELTRQVLVESCRLPPGFHGDPADQIIVATARQLEAVVISKDGRIRKYPHVRSLW